MFDGTRTSRRRLLRTTGAAVAASVGVATPAAASDFQVGDCAHVSSEARLYEYGCPPGNQIGTVTPGTCGFIEGLCDKYGTATLNVTDGWVAQDTLSHC